jgi:hypothetical protein
MMPRQVFDCRECGRENLAAKEPEEVPHGVAK